MFNPFTDQLLQNYWKTQWLISFDSTLVVKICDFRFLISVMALAKKRSCKKNFYNGDLLALLENQLKNLIAVFAVK
jgi:hypothetical protein